MPANPQLETSQPASSRCQGKTKNGGIQCSLKAESGLLYCVLHDPTEEGKAKRAQLAKERGQQGAKQKQKNRREKAIAVSLGTTAKIRELLEEAAAMVKESGEAACTKAHALARIASVAHTTIATTDLEREVIELRALVEQRLGKK
jgi:hypothetical protein